MEQAMEDDLMDINDAAKYLGVKKWTLYRLAKKGKIPGVCIGGQWKFKRSVLDRLTGEYLGDAPEGE